MPSGWSSTTRLDPDLASAYVSRGVVYHELGEYEPAIVDYNTAIRLDPDLVEAYFNRGSVYADKGEYRSGYS